MCNLYSMTRSREAMLRLFRVGDNRAAAIEPKPAIFPGYVAPVVRKGLLHSLRAPHYLPPHCQPETEPRASDWPRLAA